MTTLGLAVRLVCAAALLTAGGFKAVAPAADPTFSNPSNTARWRLLAAVELLLAGLILSNPDWAIVAVVTAAFGTTVTIGGSLRLRRVGACGCGLPTPVKPAQFVVRNALLFGPAVIAVVLSPSLSHSIESSPTDFAPLGCVPVASVEVV